MTPIVEQDTGIAINRTGSFVSGANGTYLLSVDNFGTRPTTGDTVVTSTLAASLGFVSVSGDGWSCNAAGQDVTCTRTSSIDPETPVPDISLRVSVGPDAAPSVATTAHVATDDDRNPDNDSATDTAVVTGPDLVVSSAHAGAFRVGATGEYTLEVENQGDGPTTGTTTVTDTLPPGLSHVDAAGAGWACSAAGQVVTCERSAEIGAGDTAPPIGLDVGVEPQAAPSVTNDVSVSSPSDTETVNDSAQDPTLVEMVDLAIDLQHTGGFAVGSRGDYLVEVTNEGSHPTVGTTRVTDILPTGLTPLEAGGPGWTCSISGATVSCTRAAPLGVGDTAPELGVSVDIGSATSSPVTNAATVASTDDGNTANDTDDDEANVSQDPDLALSMSAQPVTGLRVGGEASYLMKVRNVGGSPTAATATLDVVLADGLDLASSTNPDWDCSSSGQDVTCEHAGPIAAGALSEVELEIAVGGDVGGTLTTDAEIAVAADHNSSNDVAQVSSLTDAIDLEVTRSHTGDWQAGGQGAYEVKVANDGTADTVAPTVVTETLPAGVTLASASGEGWSCAGSGDVVVCTRDATIPADDEAPPIAYTVDLGNAAVPSVTPEAKVATEDDVDPANDVATETIAVAARPLLSPLRLPAEIVSRKVRATSTGVVNVFIRCPDAAEVRCQGQLSLQATAKLGKGRGRTDLALGAGAFDVARGRFGVVAITLSKSHRSVLKQLGKLKARATADTVGAGVTTRKVVVKATP